jgi:NAD(P)-dependent dehydrogenase (short-subunit alcohol dehydrogenase family)
VYAGVRRPEDADGLRGERVVPVVLDITDGEQVAALVATLPAGLDALVNNAGVVVSGPVEALPLAELRRQLEVNVVGQVAVTQAVLPRLRASRGRIVFVSSLSGRVATPLSGAYNASKFALEALADCLRMELWPWGIRVAVIEPAQTDTDVWRQADAALDADLAQLTPEHLELYAGHIEGMRRMIPRSQRMASPVDGVVDAIESALTARRRRPRRVVGAGPRLQSVLASVTPTRVRDALLRAATGVPRKAGR